MRAFCILSRSNFVDFHFLFYWLLGLPHLRALDLSQCSVDDEFVGYLARARGFLSSLLISPSLQDRVYFSSHLLS